MKQRRSAKILVVTATGVALAVLGLWLVPRDVEAIPSAELAMMNPCYMVVGFGGCTQSDCCTKSTTPASFCDFSDAHTPGSGVPRFAVAKTGGGILEPDGSVLYCTSYDCGPVGGMCGQVGCGVTGKEKLKYTTLFKLGECVMPK